MKDRNEIAIFEVQRSSFLPYWDNQFAGEGTLIRAFRRDVERDVMGGLIREVPPEELLGLELVRALVRDEVARLLQPPAQPAPAVAPTRRRAARAV
jgi:hypothetical protein